MISLIINEHRKILAHFSTKWIFISLILLNLLNAILLKRLLTGAGIGDNAIGFTAFSGQVLLAVQLFAIVIAGSMVSKEYGWDTMKSLLLLPKSRSKILSAKFLTTMLFTLYLYLFYFISSIVTGVLFFGIKYTAVSSRSMNYIGADYLTSMAEAFLLGAFAFALSSLSKNSSMAIGLAFILALTGRTTADILSHFEVLYGKYFLFSITNVRQYTEGGQIMFEGMTPLFSAAMGISYLILFLLPAWWFFVKRDVT
ncbi:ABC transporter permease subunit [Bacillus lacus]|uniref:ABC transporter permease subunit n=1 Tax=Metabacillus lacus TaxID=1983721 RepID=A0A7X2IWA2_9BACI|nr:ABC transporter permease [Metabacillus lacus]MRX70795.1 ABC transporter permease subunit [Metabacillus lacus]